MIRARLRWLARNSRAVWTSIVRCGLKATADPIDREAIRGKSRRLSWTPLAQAVFARREFRR